MPTKPPIVTRGPWRSAEPALRVEPQEEHSWLSAMVEIFFNLDSVFVILRFVGHLAVAGLHAIFTFEGSMIMRDPITLFFAVVMVVTLPFTFFAYWLLLPFAVLTLGSFIMETFHSRF